MLESVNSLEYKYLQEQEKAWRARDKNGKYTKEGLRHLIESARTQLTLASMTHGETAEQYREVAYEIIREVHSYMVQQRLIVPSPQSNSGEMEQPLPEQGKQATWPEREATLEDDPAEKLAKLIGLGDVKTTINSVLSLLKVNDEREKRDIQTLNVPLNMVFEGHAGTGKSTVARLVAQIYQRRGLLSKGHFVEVKSNDLVGQHVGHSQEKTREVIERAMGGILFIDEAYALADNFYGRSEVIPLLLTEMEDNRKDFAVIVAGYTENMRTFIESNEGLRSRFPHFIHFNDYTAQEMLEIFQQMGRNSQQELTQEAKAELLKILEEKEKDPDFGNGRGVRNLFDMANMAQAVRFEKTIENWEKIDSSMLTTLTLDDILEANEKCSEGIP